MRQFLLCVIMLICSIFMYGLVTLLEESKPTTNTATTEVGTLAEFGAYQQ